VIEFENTVPVTVKLIARTLVPTGINSPEVTVDRDATTDDLTAAGYIEADTLEWSLMAIIAQLLGVDEPPGFWDDEPQTEFGTDADLVMVLARLVVQFATEQTAEEIVDDLDEDTRTALVAMLSDRVIS
jgi:hypothetical protein